MLPAIHFDPRYPERHAGFCVHLFREVKVKVNGRWQIVACIQIEKHGVEAGDAYYNNFKAEQTGPNVVTVTYPTQPHSYIHNAKDLYNQEKQKMTFNKDISSQRERERLNYKKESQRNLSKQDIIFEEELTNELFTGQHTQVLDCKIFPYQGRIDPNNALLTVPLCTVRWRIAIRSEDSQDIEEIEEADADEELRKGIAGMMIVNNSTSATADEEEVDMLGIDDDYC